jgi:hypothetical protein
MIAVIRGNTQGVEGYGRGGGGQKCLGEGGGKYKETLF